MALYTQNLPAGPLTADTFSSLSFPHDAAVEKLNYHSFSSQAILESSLKTSMTVDGHPAAMPKKADFILTLVAATLTAAEIHELLSFAAAESAEVMEVTTLTNPCLQRKYDWNKQIALQFKLASKTDLSVLQATAKATFAGRPYAISVQKANLDRAMRRLAVFDMDSTLIQCECIDEFAVKAGSGDAVKEVTEAAMRGELDFTESLYGRVGTLKGLSASALDELKNNIPETSGMGRLIKTLKAYGFTTGLLSGGFTYIADEVQRLHGFDYVHSNVLEFADGALTGKVLGEVIDSERKAHYLGEIAKRHNIPLEQSVAVGDGANDLPMINKAGLGIAFDAKPLVQEQASHVINDLGLDATIYLLGYSDHDCALIEQA